jgi:hypothetical protein
VREGDVHADGLQKRRLVSTRAPILAELKFWQQCPEPGFGQSSVDDLEQGVSRDGSFAVATQDQSLNLF